MLVFSANDVDAVSVMRALNKLNGTDAEMRINDVPFSITFLRSAATGSEAQDELLVEFVWKVSDKETLSKAYDILRKGINEDVKVAVSTVEFRAKIADTTKFPPNTDLDDMMSSKFSISLNNVHKSTELKMSSAKKKSFVFLKVPDIAWDVLKSTVEKPVEELPPHVTISCLENVTEGQFDAIKKILLDVASEFSGFTVKVQGFKKFGPDKHGYADVALLDCPQLSKFKEALDERLFELDSELVSEKHPYYCPHVTVQYSKKGDPVQFVKPVAWTAREICLDLNDKEHYSFALNGALRKETLVLMEESKLKQAGYKLVQELEDMDYVVSANALRHIINSISDNTTANKLRSVSAKIQDPVLAKRCVVVAEAIEYALDDRIRDALSPYVDPEKMDVALNAVLEVVNTEGDEIAGMGPGAPGTDSHIVTYTKAPQTMDIPSGAPKTPVAVEFGKRNF